MKNSIYVIDDIIDSKSQDYLEGYFLNNIKDDSFFDNTSNRFKTKFPQYSMGILGPIMPTLNSNDISDELINSIEEIRKNVSKELNLSFLQNYRIKANLLKKTDYDKTRDEKLSIHIDRYENYVGMIYYINDTDGDTFFYNDSLKNKTEWMKYVYEGSDFDVFELRETVKPKKGRVVVFDGMLFHHSSYPTISDRYVINFNEVIRNNIGLL